MSAVVHRARVRFERLEREDRYCLRATFAVTFDGDDRAFRATVRLDRVGMVLNLHVSEGVEYDGPTTGDLDLDARIAEAAQEELARARAAAVVARMDREASR